MFSGDQHSLLAAVASWRHTGTALPPERVALDSLLGAELHCHNARSAQAPMCSLLGLDDLLLHPSELLPCCPHLIELCRLSQEVPLKVLCVHRRPQVHQHLHRQQFQVLAGKAVQPHKLPAEAWALFGCLSSTNAVRRLAAASMSSTCCPEPPAAAISCSRPEHDHDLCLDPVADSRFKWQACSYKRGCHSAAGGWPLPAALGSLPPVSCSPAGPVQPCRPLLPQHSIPA